MKRIGNLYSKVCDLDNLILAEKKARRGKKLTKEMLLFDLNKMANLRAIQQELINKTFTTSKYHIFKINEGKERIVFKLPIKDRIVHHALINILEPILFKYFTVDTYSCIKGRGIHKASFNLRKALKSKENTLYCLKLDIRKFYPSVKNEILINQLKNKFKDRYLLWLMENIIMSAIGQPIGNLTSQYFANFYLTKFDRFVKQDLRVKHYFRYCDDLVILGNDKEELRVILNKIQTYLAENLQLQLNNKYQIFPVEKRGIDFVGYVHYHTHVELRKSIKKRFIKMLFKDRNLKSIASYNGWLLYGNTISLRRKYLVA